MSDHMMSVEEARNLIKVLESATAGAIELWNFEEKQLSAARTIVAQAEQIERLQAAMRITLPYVAGGGRGIETYYGLLPGDMEDPEVKG